MVSQSLKNTIIVRLLVPVFCFLLIETALSYYVTLHYVDKTYDRWLLNSAHALEQEIKIKEQKISVELFVITSITLCTLTKSFFISLS